MILDGVWLVQFEGVQGRGGGVVTLINGKLFGGDNGYTYIGSYETDGKTLSANVQVQQFLPGIPNVTGIEGDLDLKMRGTIEGDRITGSAHLANHQAVGIVMKLTKRSDL